MQSVSLTAPRQSKTYPYGVNRTVTERGPFSIMRGRYDHPKAVEIKRAIAAAERPGIAISSIEIHPRKIIILSRETTDDKTKELAFSEWKAAQYINR